MSKPLAEKVKELQAELPKKSRGAGKRVSFEKDTAVERKKLRGDSGDTIELGSFSKVDTVSGITPTGKAVHKGKAKYPQLSLASKVDIVKKAQAGNDPVDLARFEDPMKLLSKIDSVEEVASNPRTSKAIGSLNRVLDVARFDDPIKLLSNIDSLSRVSETDSQATLSSNNVKDSQATPSSDNAKLSQEQSAPLTDSVPSEIGDSQTSAWGTQVNHCDTHLMMINKRTILSLQMKPSIKRVNKRSSSKKGAEAETPLKISSSNNSLNETSPDELRANSKNSRDSRASFRLDANTLEVELAGQMPDTLEMAIPRPEQDPRVSPEQEESVAAKVPQSTKVVGATKARVAFSLVGRVKERRRARVEEKVVSFTQLGRLASLTPLRTGPTLQELVVKRVKEEVKAMLPPEATTTPQTGARMAVSHWLANAETPESLAPTTLGMESPFLTKQVPTDSRSRACSTLVGSLDHPPASSPPQASTVPTPRLDSTQDTPNTVATFKDQTKAGGTLEERENNAERASSNDLDAEFTKVVADTGEDDPDKRLSFERDEWMCKEMELVSRKAAEEVISIVDEESRDCTETEPGEKRKAEEAIMVDEESRELPEVEDDFIDPDQPDENAIEDDFMAKILDTQAEFAFTQERRGVEDQFEREKDFLPKRGREESDDEEPLRVPFKRSRRIESDDEDETKGDDDDDAENRPAAEEMDEGKNTQGETLKAMVEAAEEVSQARREVEEEMENDMTENNSSVMLGEDPKAGPAGDIFEVTEDCEFLADDDQAMEEKEMFDKYEHAAADAPSQEPSLGAGNVENIKMEDPEVEERAIKVDRTEDSEDGGPESDVRVIPESDEDFFSQSSSHSVVPRSQCGSQSSNHSMGQGLPVALQCSPIPEFPEGSDCDETDLLGNTEEEDNPLVPVDTTQWRFASSNLSTSARNQLPDWAESLGCRGVHTKVRMYTCPIL